MKPSTSQTALIIIGILSFSTLLLWGCPVYRVWRQGKVGQAQLRQAEQNRQIKVQEARATKEAAALLAEADTTRAHGIARSQQIINGTLTPAYIHWFWIDNLEKNNQSVIYVPTEANLPVMEAGRFFKMNADSIANAKND